MLYSEIKERENRFILSLKIALPFLFVVAFAILVIVTDLDIKSLLKNNIISFLVITFLYIYYILYQIYMAFKTSLIDNITKAFSRDYILKIVDIEKKYEDFTVVLLKINNIEDINDRYGIKKTDKILMLFVYKLDEFLKEEGFKNNKIGHIIGGSFLLVLQTDEKKANHFIKQFIKKIENGQIDNIFLKIFYSVSLSSSENSAEELLVSLYEKIKSDSKDRRKRRINIKVREFEKLIVNCVKNRDFDFRFQPMEDTKTKEIKVYELLVRLNSKKYGKISQNQFISVVNRIGYELAFDMIIVEEIFKIATRYKNMIFSINISSYSIRNSQFLNRVKKLLKNYDIKKYSIIFEINANNTLNDIARLNENINMLKNFGILIAIDSFGTDNTSFKYIKNINFDIVKFDIDYSKRYTEKKHQEILKAFIKIFKSLNVKTVIKFIEDEESYKFFKNIEIDYIQGFIIGKPVKNITS